MIKKQEKKKKKKHYEVIAHLLSPRWNAKSLAASAEPQILIWLNAGMIQIFSDNNHAGYGENKHLSLNAAVVQIHPQIALGMRLIGRDRSSAIWIISPPNKSDFFAGRPISFCWAFFVKTKKRKTKLYFSLVIQFCINAPDKWNVLNLKATPGALMWSLLDCKHTRGSDCPAFIFPLLFPRQWVALRSKLAADLTET